MKKELKLIKQVILSKLSDRVERIILFGSRAKKAHSKLSDYDILIVLKDDISIEEKVDISEDIRGELAELEIDADIIVKTKKDVEYFSDKIGSLVRTALKEGIAL